jgi:hypothetical protein
MSSSPLHRPQESNRLKLQLRDSEVEEGSLFARDYGPNETSDSDLDRGEISGVHPLGGRHFRWSTS